VRTHNATSLQASAQPDPRWSRNQAIVFGFILVFLVAGIGAAYSVGLFSSGGLTQQHTSTPSTATTSITESLSASSMPPGCILASKVSSQGYSLEVLLSNSTKIGGNVCVGLIVRNVSGGAPNVQGIIQKLNITDSSGKVVSVMTPVVLASGTLRPGQYISGMEFWNSGTAYGGITPQPGAYHVTVDVKIPQDGPSAATELTADADFFLTN
jgi:hypothetical protein